MHSKEMAVKTMRWADSTSGGMEPSFFVQKALRAIAKGQPEVLIGGKEIMAVYLKRFSPRVLTWVLRRAKVT